MYIKIIAYISILFAINFVITVCLPVTLIEGQPAFFEFQFQHHDDFYFSIQHGNQDPFYKSIIGHIDKAGLSKDQLARLSVHTERADESTILVQLQIVNTTRHDAGSYKCIGTKRNQPELSVKKIIELSIEYPPGKAKCNFKERVPNTKSFTFLTCTANSGSQPGIFQCYQECNEIPNNHKSNENQTSIWQVFRVKKSKSFTCCTSLRTEPKDLKHCHDFEWTNHGKDKAQEKLCFSSIEESATSKPGESIRNSNIPTKATILTNVLFLIGNTLCAILVCTLLCLKKRTIDRNHQNNTPQKSPNVNVMQNEEVNVSFSESVYVLQTENKVIKVE